MKILFWDVDGTLLHTGRAGLFAIEQALTDLTGNDQIKLQRFNAGGRTDNYICQQILYQATGQMPTDEEVFSFCRHYETLLVDFLKRTQGEVIHPVPELLSYFDRQEEYVQLLLTGNSREGAERKLTHYGIDHYFDFDLSGFAEHFYYRNDLAAYAWEKVKNAFGDTIEDVFVIGDTPFDVECGKHIGAKTIAVATGARDLQTLQDCMPWWAVQRLPNPEEMKKQLEK